MPFSRLRRPIPRLIRRGTLRAPGANLRHLPVGLDFANINLAEGLRAAVASGAVLLVNAWVHSPALLFIAFAANLACFCDIGGALRSRVPALIAFTLIGALLWAGVGLLHGFGPPVLLPISAIVVFCNSMARVWGARAQAVGAVMTVVLALAVDRTLDVAEARMLFLAFIAGGAWAVLLTIGIWRINPERRDARLVAGNWHLLARFTRDLSDLLGADPSRTGSRLEAFEAHARAHRRALRDALEETRASLLASVRPPGLATSPTARALLAVEDQDRVFGALIALSDVLEASEDPTLGSAAARVLRRLRPLLDLAGREAAFVRPERLERALSRMIREAGAHSPLADIVAVLGERLRIAYRLKGEETGTITPDADLARGSTAGWLAPLLANLTWSSAILRHAVRAAVLTVAAVAISLVWWSVYAHWLVITVALTMQPYFAATWQRALERIGGTVLGALLGAGLAFFPQGPFADAILMIPLSIIGFSVRQVSYGAYITCLTPLVVILFDVAEPGHGQWLVAAMRTAYTVGGGLVAVLACMVLWPSWEPERTAQGFRDALLAHARYAEAVLTRLIGQPDPTALEAARRAAGVSCNNLEASLSRALQEPTHRHARRLESLMAADAGLRRLGGALLALQHDSHAGEGVSDATLAAWRAWVPNALDALGRGDGQALPAPPVAPPQTTLARIGRIVEVLSDIVADLSDEGEPRRAIVPMTGDAR